MIYRYQIYIEISGFHLVKYKFKNTFTYLKLFDASLNYVTVYFNPVISLRLSSMLTRFLLYLVFEVVHDVFTVYVV